MSPLDVVRGAFAPPLTGAAQWLLRRLCTGNPFYVLSAGLFLIGLRVSFGPEAGAIQTWSLMSGLAGYTLLLALTACLLVRFGNVWDDVRTVLLLVVLMFLATSVTFDDVLVNAPGQGPVCYLGGLLFAVAVSEGLLRGMRLRLPAVYRVPYYLILALFFLYPLALAPVLREPHSEALLWGLFGFSSAAGLVFLTLLPAVRRGPECVRDNGSPWRWPLYPWALFGLLGLAVPARAFLLCWSMHLLGARDLDQVVFGLYFLVPFGLAVAVLLLEAGLVCRRRAVLGAALAAPVGLVALALVGHRPDAIYQELLGVFTARLGGDPLYLTLLAAAAFYGYAVLRGVRPAADALTGVLAALAVIGPDTLLSRAAVAPRPTPILAAAALQLLVGARRRAAWRCLLGCGGLMAGALLLLPEEDAASPLLVPVVFHLGLLAVLAVGAACDDAVGRLSRVAGAALALFACLTVLFVRLDVAAGVPPWVVAVYPPALAVGLAAYGRLLGHRFSLGAAALALTVWLGVTFWRGYFSLRLVVTGLDQLAQSLALFALAVLVSLAKSGSLSRWISVRGLRLLISVALYGARALDARADGAPGPSPRTGPLPSD
jgi:hypothetical protein